MTHGGSRGNGDGRPVDLWRQRAVGPHLAQRPEAVADHRSSHQTGCAETMGVFYVFFFSGVQNRHFRPEIGNP